MTLCIAWNSANTVHFASDSRLTIAKDSYADVGIKVLSIPYRILAPANSMSDGPRVIAFSGELGMCFAGSAINSLTIKQSLEEVLKSLQYAPGYTDSSIEGVARFAFTAYRLISKRICETAIGERGRALIALGGYCHDAKRYRVFKFTTDTRNNHEMTEILKNQGDYELMGDGAPEARAILKGSTITDRVVFSTLKAVIDNPSAKTVGGNIQYGRFVDQHLEIFGIAELASGVHYWRGALDMNSQDFMSSHDSLVPGMKYIDPFNTFG